MLLVLYRDNIQVRMFFLIYTLSTYATRARKTFLYKQNKRLSLLVVFDFGRKTMSPPINILTTSIHATMPTKGMNNII